MSRKVLPSRLPRARAKTLSICRLAGPHAYTSQSDGTASRKTRVREWGMIRGRCRQGKQCQRVGGNLWRRPEEGSTRRPFFYFQRILTHSGEGLCGLPELGTAVERRAVSCISCTWLQSGDPWLGERMDHGLIIMAGWWQHNGINGWPCQSGKGATQHQHWAPDGPMHEEPKRHHDWFRSLQCPRIIIAAGQREKALLHQWPLQRPACLLRPKNQRRGLSRALAPYWGGCRRPLLLAFWLSQCRVSRCKKGFPDTPTKHDVSTKAPTGGEISASILAKW